VAGGIELEVGQLGVVARRQHLDRARLALAVEIDSREREPVAVAVRAEVDVLTIAGKLAGKRAGALMRGQQRLLAARELEPVQVVVAALREPIQQA
jgi:hypothetical protein